MSKNYTAMEQPPPDLITKSLADILRESLRAGESVRLPGLGTFTVEHRPSEIVEQENGLLTMRPPRDEVVFTPES